MSFFGFKVIPRLSFKKQFGFAIEVCYVCLLSEKVFPLQPSTTFRSFCSRKFVPFLAQKRILRNILNKEFISPKKFKLRQKPEQNCSKVVERSQNGYDFYFNKFQRQSSLPFERLFSMQKFYKSSSLRILSSIQIVLIWYGLCFFVERIILIY